MNAWGDFLQLRAKIEQRLRWRRRVTACCVGLSVLTTIYFFAQLARAYFTGAFA